jgi:hypothetical protein
MENLIATTTEQRTKATTRLNEYVETAKRRSAGALNRIMSEVPTDRIMQTERLEFVPTGGGVAIDLGHGVQYIHNNALEQISQRIEVPSSYLKGLRDRRDDWSTELLARTMREHFGHQPGARVLVRSVGQEVRAMLSDKYRRIDCRPGLDALAQAAQARGAIVGDAIATDTRVSVKWVTPRVLEPTPGEFLVFGFEWSNSDFGRGAETLRTFIMRLFCWNGATMEQAMREVHLGRRLSDDVEYTDRTYRLDQKASVSALTDTAHALLSDASVNKVMGSIATAAVEGIDVKAKLVDLRKRVGKGIADQVGEAFNTGGVEMLPVGNTAWRWSNALSWVAGHTDDNDQRLDLERLAGAALAN